LGGGFNNGERQGGWEKDEYQNNEIVKREERRERERVSE